MDLNLAGRTAVISGGSMGIGKAIASGLAAEGVNLVLLARGQEALNETASEIDGAHDVDILTISTDIRDSESVNAMAPLPPAENGFRFMANWEELGHEFQGCD